LKNIIEHPQVGILFMIPGMNETLRVNGRARISRDPELCASFTFNGRPARSVLLVTVEQAFLQCAKALVRSKLWDPDVRVERKSLPSMGRMLADHVGGLDADAFDREASDMVRNPETLY
jgi:predicted pyridoxine 5'-phosphate oxidase superfamily flavin-nucleotide-binding protein